MAKKSVKKSKNQTVIQTGEKGFYLPILELLKTSTNLTEIRKKLSLSKQNLNYYLQRLKEKGIIVKKDHGWWEVVKKSKNQTEYGIFTSSRILPKDFIRGHAYIWNIYLKELKNVVTKFNEKWEKRKQILDQKNINYKMVGVFKDIPRIKVLGRKVWLCKDHLRIFDKNKASYYGEDSIKARNKAMSELFLILRALESKLGLKLNDLDVEWKKQHYAFIRNDLAIDQNRKGIIWRISDQDGEWLLIDDSLEEGGELENIGKGSFKTNLKMQKWWNENKETDFKVTPKFILGSFNQSNNQIKGLLELAESRKQADIMLMRNQELHFDLLRGIKKELNGLSDAILKLKSESKN